MLCNFCKPLPVHIIIIHVYLSECFFDFCQFLFMVLSTFLSYDTLYK